MDQISIQDIILLRCQNAALETELRVVRDQLAQANNATVFLASTFSNARPGRDEHVSRLQVQLKRALAENARLRRLVLDECSAEQRVKASKALDSHDTDRKMRAMSFTDGSLTANSGDTDLLVSYEDYRSTLFRIDSPMYRQSRNLSEAAIIDKLNKGSESDPVCIDSGLQRAPAQVFAANLSNLSLKTPAHTFTNADGSTIEVLVPSTAGPSTPAREGTDLPLSTPATPMPRYRRLEFDQYDRSHLLSRATWLEGMGGEEYAEVWTDLGKKKPRHSAEEWQEYYEEIVRPEWYAQEEAKAKAAEEQERQRAPEAGARCASRDQTASSAYWQNAGEPAGFGETDGEAGSGGQCGGESSVRKEIAPALEIAGSHKSPLSHSHKFADSSATCSGDGEGADSRLATQQSDLAMAACVGVKPVARPADGHSDGVIEAPGMLQAALKISAIDWESKKVDSPLTESDESPPWKESELGQDTALPQAAEQGDSPVGQFHSTPMLTPPEHPVPVEGCDHTLAQPSDRPTTNLDHVEGRRSNPPLKKERWPRCCNRPYHEEELKHEHFRHDPSVLRNVEIKGIPPNMLLADILDLVRGGQILGAVYIDLVALNFRPGSEARSNMAVITFLYAREALLYVQRCRKEPSLLSVTSRDGRTTMLTLRLLRYPILPFDHVSIGDVRDKRLSRILYLHDDGKHSADSALGWMNARLGKRDAGRWPLRAGRDKEGMLVFEFKSVHDAVLMKQAMDGMLWEFGHMPKGFLMDPCQIPFPKSDDAESADAFAQVQDTDDAFKEPEKGVKASKILDSGCKVEIETQTLDCPQGPSTASWVGFGDIEAARAIMRSYGKGSGRRGHWGLRRKGRDSFDLENAEISFEDEAMAMKYQID